MGRRPVSNNLLHRQPSHTIIRAWSSAGGGDAAVPGAVDTPPPLVKLYVDLATGHLIEGPGFRNPVTSLRFKRGDAATLEVVFLADGTTAAHLGDPANVELHFGVKLRGRYDGGYLVHTSAWTMPAAGVVNPVYRCSPSFNTEELNDALGVGSETGTEFPEITLMGEITWRAGAAEPTSTRTFLVVVENDVNRGTEGVPVEASPPYPAPENIEFVTRKGAANGYAGLDSNGTLPLANLPIHAHDAHAASHAIDGVTWIATNVEVDLTCLPAEIASLGAGTHELVFAVTFSDDQTNRTIAFGRSGTGEFKDPADGTATASIDAQGTEFTMQCGAGGGTTRYAFVTFACAGTETISATGVSGTVNSVSVGVISREAAQTDTVMVDVAAQAIGILPLANGGTGAATAPLARAALGITSAGDSVVTAASLEALNALLDSTRGKNCTVVVESDFFSVGNTAIPGLAGGAISNGGSILQGLGSGTPSSNHPGLATLQSGTNANSGYYYGSSGSAGLLICGREKATLVFYVATSVTTTYWRFGFMDSFSVADPTDGVFLLVQGDGTGATATGRVVSDGSITDTATTYGLSLATFYSVVVEVNAAATLATFSIYSEAGALLWSDTAANLPKTVGRHTSLGLVAYRTDASTAALVIVSVDYVRWEIGRNLTR